MSNTAEKTVIERTISEPVLVYYWDKYSEEYNQDFPKVKDPQALLAGIKELCSNVGDGDIPDTICLYVIDKENHEADPAKAEYLIVISNDTDLTPNHAEGYSLRLFYRPTGELESISTFEEHQVVWSPDTMSKTLHPKRTSYYMGFAYMLCEKSPGFDTEPLPELELTGAELLELGVEGELPPEIIEIALPEENITNESEKEQETDTTIEFEEEDDTQIVTTLHNLEDQNELDKEEEQYNDLFVDYEELFDD